MAREDKIIAEIKGKPEVDPMKSLGDAVLQDRAEATIAALRSQADAWEKEAKKSITQERQKHLWGKINRAKKQIEEIKNESKQLNPPKAVAKDPTLALSTSDNPMKREDFIRVVRIISASNPRKLERSSMHLRPVKDYLRTNGSRKELLPFNPQKIKYSRKMDSTSVLALEY